MAALFAAIFSTLVGLVMGAAIQRWGDGDRATHGHKRTPPTIRWGGTTRRPAVWIDQ